MDTDGNDQFYLNELSEMIVKLYHDEEGNVDEAGKQSEKPTLWLWMSRSACMGKRRRGVGNE